MSDNVLVSVCGTTRLNRQLIILVSIDGSQVLAHSMAKSTSPQPGDLIPAMVVFGVFGAIPAALIGMVVSGGVAKRFDLPLTIWHGLIVGALIGAVVGAFRAYLQYQRLMAMQQHAAYLGLKPLAGAFLGELSGRLERLFEKRVPFVTAHAVKNESAEVVVGDIRLASEVRRNGRNQLGNTSEHSYVYVKFSEVEFPRFNLYPETALIRMADSFQDRDIDFDDSIEFSQNYHLNSDAPEKACRLFDDSLRQVIGRRRDWEIRGDRSWLVFLSRRRFKTPDDQQQFVAQCLELATKFSETSAVG